MCTSLCRVLSSIIRRELLGDKGQAKRNSQPNKPSLKICLTVPHGAEHAPPREKEAAIDDPSSSSAAEKPPPAQAQRSSPNPNRSAVIPKPSKTSFTKSRLAQDKQAPCKRVRALAKAASCPIRRRVRRSLMTHTIAFYTPKLPSAQTKTLLCTLICITWNAGHASS